MDGDQLSSSLGEGGTFGRVKKEPHISRLQPEINVSPPEGTGVALKLPAVRIDTSTSSNNLNNHVERGTKRASRHRKRSVSPRNYLKSIVAHSRRSIASCTFPGQNYIELAAWLQLQIPNRRSQSVYQDLHCLAVLHNLGFQGSGRTLYLQCDSLELLKSQPRPDSEFGQVFFLRGVPSADWVGAIGAKYQIDPEFFYRHLGFLSTLVPQVAFTWRALPSSSTNIMKLHISTILYTNGPKNRRHDQDLCARRREEADGMDTYRRQFPVQTVCGDSIIRDYVSLDHDFSILEQDISICIYENGRGWIAVVLLDIGRDLARSPAGPWVTNNASTGRMPEPQPIIQHHPKMTVRQTAIELAISSSNDHPMNGHVDHTSIPQTTAVLPFDFDTFLDGDIAKHNAFYALSNLFQHAAFSEMQVLSLLGWRIKCEMDTLETGGAHQTHSLGNLQCFRNALDRRVSYIRDTLRAVRSNEHPKWPARSQDRVEVALIAEKLIEDYEEMLAMALDLCQRCSEGMGIMMNLAVVAESQKSIELAQRLKKLTVLASFFIPLTFTCSLFGMNFREFGQGNLHVWLFVIVAIPMVTLSFFFYTYDMADSYRASVDRVSRLWRFRRSPL